MLCMMLPAATRAASLSMEYSLGFNGYFQLKTWSPLTVVLENRGRAISGQVEVVVTSGSEYRGDVYQTVYAMDVELPYNSKKLVAFTPLIDYFTHELLIRFRQDDEILLTESINLRPHYVNHPLAVVLTSTLSPDFLSAFPDEVFAVNVRPAYLPETRYGYEGVAVIIVEPGMLKSLRERQFQALVEWVRHGGYLLTSGSMNYGPLQEERVQRLFPMQVLGHQRLEALHSLAQFGGQPLTSPISFLALRVRMPEAKILAQEANLPVILQRHHGLGKVIFLAFDVQNPPFNVWPNRTAFWREILALRPVPRQSPRTANLQKTLDTMLAAMPIDFPNFWIVCGFLAVYVLALFGMLRQIGRRPEKRFNLIMMALALIVAASVVSYRLFLYQNIKKNLTYNSFLQLDLQGQDSIAAARHITGIYTIEPATYSMSFASASYPVTHVLRKDAMKKVPDSYALHESHFKQRIIGTTEEWSHNFFLIETTLDLPLLAEARLKAQDLYIIIDNRTAYTIQECYLYFDNHLFAVDDLAPHEKFSVIFSQEDLENAPPFTAQVLENITPDTETLDEAAFAPNIKAMINRSTLWAIHEDYANQADELALIGWIEASVLPPQFHRSEVVGENLTFLRWDIPIGGS